MKRKFELNLDAAVCLLIVFVLLVGFLMYQRHQYGLLHDRHIQLQWQAAEDSLNLKLAQSRLQKLQQETSEKNGEQE